MRDPAPWTGVPTARPLAGQTVLVVEDDYLLASDIADAAQRAGAEVLGPCPTEAAALECLEEHGPTAALVDINLGAGASFRLARALQGRSVPFLFVTGYDAAAIPAEFASVPRLEKPVRPHEVIGSLAALLGPELPAG